jgi:hypothetical protein
MYDGTLLPMQFSRSNMVDRNIPRQQRSSPSRDGTRVHLYSTPPYECSNNLSYALFPSRPHDYTSERRPLKMPKRLSPKAGLVKTPSHLMDMDLDLPSPCQRNDVQRHIPPVSDLRSCHACNKAPKRKTELENYLDCRRCEGRTCFICARQCAGCSKAICKKCIVEVGEEGDAWCLDCYSRHINA